MTAPPAIVCVGGAAVDRSYRLAAPLLLETSNPAAGRAGFGGVARNVAAGLARAGAAVELVSRVGTDAAGRDLLLDLDRIGIGRAAVRAVPGAATAEYVAVLTPAGDLAVGLAAMSVLDALTPAALGGHASLLAAAPWVFADCNLPAPSLGALAGRAFGGAARLAVDAVSVAKAARLPERLDGVDVLFLNRDEAAAAARRLGLADARPGPAAAALLRAGAGAAVVTLGSEGAIVASASGLAAVPAAPARVVDVTGAGDALIAATLRALASGAGLVEAVAHGCAAAARAVAMPGTATAEAAPATDR